MITLSQLASALYGVWLLLKLDPRGFDYFEKTPGGFARSFLVAAVLSPLYFAHAVLTYHGHKTKLAFMPYLVVQTLSDVLSWVAFPFAMLYVTELLSRQGRYLTYMVGYNWFQLAVGCALLPIAVLADLGFLSMKFAGFLNLLALVVFFTFGAFIARIGLQLGVGTAVGIVVIDLMLSLAINQAIGRI